MMMTMVMTNSTVEENQAQPVSHVHLHTSTVAPAAAPPTAEQDDHEQVQVQSERREKSGGVKTSAAADGTQDAPPPLPRPADESGAAGTGGGASTTAPAASAAAADAANCNNCAVDHADTAQRLFRRGRYDEAAVEYEAELLGLGSLEGFGLDGDEDRDVSRLPSSTSQIVERVNRAAVLHNLGLARGMARTNVDDDGDGDGDGDDDLPSHPLSCHRESFDLYRSCHRAVSSGHVAGARYVEEGHVARDATTAAAAVVVRLEALAVQSLKIMASIHASCGNVDDTIGCHEEIVSLLLGSDGDADSDDAHVEGDGASDAMKDGSNNGDGGGCGSTTAETSPSSTSKSSSASVPHGIVDTNNSSGGATTMAVQWVKIGEHERMHLISLSLDALGTLYLQRGDDDDALASYQDALDLLRSVESPVPSLLPSAPEAQHIDLRDDVGRTLLSLARLHGRRKEYDEAVDACEEALCILSDRHGDGDVADADQDQGANGGDGPDNSDNDFDAATPRSQPRHRAVLAALHALGHAHDARDDFDAAMTCYESAFLGRCQTLGKDDMSVASVLVDMSNALQRRGNVDGALELNAQALRIYRLNTAEPRSGRGGGEDEVTASLAYLTGALQNRGALHMQRGEPDDALNCYAEAMEIKKIMTTSSNNDDHHFDVARLWNTLGDINVIIENEDDARECFTEALKLYRSHGLGDNDSPVTITEQKLRMLDGIDNKALNDEAGSPSSAMDRSSPSAGDASGKDKMAEEKEFLEELESPSSPGADFSEEEEEKMEEEAFLEELDSCSGAEYRKNADVVTDKEKEAENDFLEELASQSIGGDNSLRRADNDYDEEKKAEEAFLHELSSNSNSGSFRAKNVDETDLVDGVAPRQHERLDRVMPNEDTPSSHDNNRKPHTQGKNAALPQEKNGDMPSGIQFSAPRQSDDTVSLITFKESDLEQIQRSGGDTGAIFRRKEGSPEDPPEDTEGWFSTAIGAIAEVTGEFLSPKNDSNDEKEKMAPISEVEFVVNDGQGLMPTNSDITDIIDEYGPVSPVDEGDDRMDRKSPKAAVPTRADPDKDTPALIAQGVEVSHTSKNELVLSTEYEEGNTSEVGEDIGVEVDDLLAQMNAVSKEERGTTKPFLKALKGGFKGGTKALSKKAIAEQRPSSSSAVKSKPANSPEIRSLVDTLDKQRKDGSTVDVANTLNALGDLYKKEGDLDSAIGSYTEELDMRKKAHGIGHYSVAEVLNIIGAIQLERDEFNAARDAHMQALSIQQACLGENEHNPDVSRTLVKLGAVYYKERNSLKKIQSRDDDYESFIESGMLCKIAFAHDERGEYVMAMNFYDEHVQLLKSRQDNRFMPGLINALNCLGSLNRKTGRYIEARDYHLKARNMQKSLPGIDRVEPANTSVLIGMVEFKAGNFQKATALFKEALPIQQAVYGKDHAVPARTLFNMGVVEEELANHKAAMSLLESALSIQKLALPPDHPDTLATRLYIARLHSSAGNYDLAMTTFLGVLMSQKQLFGNEHPCVADTLHQMGICQARRGKMNSALKNYEQCFTIRKDMLGYDHTDVGGVLNSIAAVHASNKRNEKALPIYEAALRIRRDALGDDHVDVARSLSNQGVAYASLRKFPEAMEVYKEAKKIREKALGKFHPAVADSHVNIGNIYLRQCLFEEARNEFEAALYVYSNSPLRDDDPKIARCTAIIERVKRDEKLCV